MSNKFTGGFLRDLTRALVVSSLVEGAKMRNGFLRGPEGELIVTPDLPDSVVSSSRYDAETEEWEPRPSTSGQVLFTSLDKEAATPGDIEKGDVILRATE